MKVVVKFDKMWPISEIENYIANPKDEKYSDMRDDVFLELLACAEYYAAARKRGDNDVQVECMNEYAASDEAWQHTLTAMGNTVSSWLTSINSNVTIRYERSK